MRGHLEYAHTLDPRAWRERHAEGLVPDSLPYGLDRLEPLGYELSVRPQPRGLLRVADGGVRRLTGGLSVLESLTARERRAADVSICWDIRSGASAAIRSRLRGEPPVVTGVIWLTDDHRELTGAGRALAGSGLRAAAAVWAMSTAQLQPLRDHWGVRKDRLHMLHMGIDADFWPCAEGPREAGLVVASGNDRHRDHRLLVDAIGRLARRRHARLELATHHPVDVPAELGERHAHLTHGEMRALYARAAVVAIATRPNLHVSGLSVLLESMASGCAVVMTDTPGVRSYVEHRVTGLLVPPGDADALAAAVGELLDDPERAGELGRAGRARVDERFSTTEQARALAEIIRCAGGP